MDRDSLRNWGALAAVVGGAGVALYNSVEFVAFSGAPLSELAQRAGWPTFQVAGLLIMLALVLGFVAVYLLHAERLGRFGLLSFVIALVGALQYYGITWTSAFVAPSVAGAAPGVLDTPDAVAMAGVLSTVLVFSLGACAFAIAGLRAALTPRWAWWLFLGGTLAGFVSEFAGIDAPLGPIAFGAAFATIGASLMTRAPQRAAATASAG